jgi:hypothetical protein
MDSAEQNEPNVGLVFMISVNLAGLVPNPQSIQWAKEFGNQLEDGSAMMQFDAQIKQAILHPESAIREYAVRHFSGSYSSDEAIVSLVIQAIEKYGRENGFGILRAADDLPLTVEAVDWLMDELQADQPAPTLEVENARFAMALLLCNPKSDLIPPRGPEILALPGFPDPLKPAMEDILKMANWDWPKAWQAFLELGKNIRRRGNSPPTSIGDSIDSFNFWQDFERRAANKFLRLSVSIILAAKRIDLIGSNRGSSRWQARCGWSLRFLF